MNCTKCMKPLTIEMLTGDIEPEWVEATFSEHLAAECPHCGYVVNIAESMQTKYDVGQIIAIEDRSYTVLAIDAHSMTVQNMSGEASFIDVEAAPTPAPPDTKIFDMVGTKVKLYEIDEVEVLEYSPERDMVKVTIGEQSIEMYTSDFLKGLGLVKGTPLQGTVQNVGMYLLPVAALDDGIKRFYTEECKHDFSNAAEQYSGLPDFLPAKPLGQIGDTEVNVGKWPGLRWDDPAAEIIGDVRAWQQAINNGYCTEEQAREFLDAHYKTTNDPTPRHVHITHDPAKMLKALDSEKGKAAILKAVRAVKNFGAKAGLAGVRSRELAEKFANEQIVRTQHGPMYTRTEFWIHQHDTDTRKCFGLADLSHAMGNFHPNQKIDTPLGEVTILEEHWSHDDGWKIKVAQINKIEHPKLAIRELKLLTVGRLIDLDNVTYIVSEIAHDGYGTISEGNNLETCSRMHSWCVSEEELQAATTRTKDQTPEQYRLAQNLRKMIHG